MNPTSLAAFVTTRSSPLLINNPSTRSLTPTALAAVPAAAYQQAALGFFNGIRFPSTLIAGSSVAALFCLTKQSKDTSGMSPLEVKVLRAYHIISLLQFCLSMTAVCMSTTGCTLLLLTSKFSQTEYSDIYHFLRGDINFEFVLTRWSFFSSLALFLAGVACRVLLEMDLLKPERKITGLLVVFTMSGVLSGILSNINLTLNCWPNLIGMTKEVIQLLAARLMQNRGPLQLISLGSFVGVFVCLVKILSSSMDSKVTES